MIAYETLLSLRQHKLTTRPEEEGICLIKTLAEFKEDWIVRIVRHQHPIEKRRLKKKKDISK